MSEFIIDFEGETEEENQMEYHNIDGYTKYGLKDLFPGDKVIGVPEAHIFINEDRKSDSLRLRIINDGEEIVVDCYAPIPKQDDGGYVKNIRKNFNFYRPAFDLLCSVMYKLDSSNIIDPKTGKVINKISKINIKQVVDYLNSLDTVEMKVLEGVDDSEYNSFKIL